MSVMGSAVGAIIVLTACGASAKPPAAAAPEEAAPALLCAMKAHGALYVFMASDPALDAAQRSFDAAGEAGDDHAAAAQHYLACAAAYRAIPDTFGELEHVLANARLCYQSAIIEYENGQLVERAGRAAVTAALADEPRAAIKADLEAELAATHDCGADE